MGVMGAGLGSVLWEKQAFSRRCSLGPAPKGSAGGPGSTPPPQVEMGEASRISRPGVAGERLRFLSG